MLLFFYSFLKEGAGYHNIGWVGYFLPKNVILHEFTNIKPKKYSLMSCFFRIFPDVTKIFIKMPATQALPWGKSNYEQVMKSSSKSEMGNF